MTRNVAVVIGVGGMGEEIARRAGPGSRLLLADVGEAALGETARRLRGSGYDVEVQVTDVTSRSSVAALAERAASLGEIRSLVHTAGLSPMQASVEEILAVDLLGVALVVEEFGKVIAPGGAGVVIASMAGHSHPPFDRETALALANVPADELLALPACAPGNFSFSGAAYSFAKRANLIRVQAANVAWTGRGARINSISPGTIATPMGQTELDGEHGASMKAMIASSNAGRQGTAAEIAHAAEFLLTPASGFISGTDLLVDGGVTAALQTGHLGTGGS